MSKCARALAQHGGAVRRVHEELRDASALTRADPARERARAAARRSRRRRDRRRSRSGSSPPPAPRPAARARARRPRAMPRRVARAEPAHAGVELDVHPPAAGGRDRLAGRARSRRPRRRRPRAPRRSSAWAQGAHHQHAHVAQARLAQLARPPRRSATASQLAPPASAARALCTRAVAVAVGLDDRAQRRAARRSSRAQPRAVALDRRDVHLRLRARARSRPARPGAVIRSRAALPIARLRHRRAHRAAPRSRRSRSRPRRRPAGAPPRVRRAACSQTPAAAAVNASRPCGEQRGDHAREHVAGAGRRERRAAARADGDPPVGVGDQRVVALQHDHRPRALGGRRERGAGARARSPRCRSSSRRPSSPACGVSTVGAAACRQRRRAVPRGRSARRRRAPAASSRARARARARSDRARRCARARVRAPAPHPARLPRARSSTPSAVSGPSSSAQPAGHQLRRPALARIACSEAGTHAVT